MNTLRDYQQVQHNKVMNFLNNSDQVRGQVYSPTGSGKTVNFFEVIRELVSHSTKPLSIAIVHPRIALSTQQQERFSQEKFSADFGMTPFHSGTAYKRANIKHLDTSTLSTAALVDIIDSNHANERHHITFSSYHSLHKLTNVAFDLIICDESHNMVPSDTDENNTAPKKATLRNLKSENILFYTATPITDETEECVGMNNPDMFGEIISTTEPLSLIRKGYIVGPVVNVLDISTDGQGIGVDTTDVVIASFKTQLEEMKKYGLNKIQMLVCSRGYADHKRLEEDLKEIWTALGRDVDLYTIEANESRKNGRGQKDRYSALEDIKQSKTSSIVVHYDTISEGIDISGLTGVCLLRKMKKSKLLQTIGRMGRPYSLDLDSNYEVIDMDKRLKPHSILTLPIVDGEHISGGDSKDISDAFILGGYGELAEVLSHNGVNAISATAGDNDDEEAIDQVMSVMETYTARIDDEAIKQSGLVID